jgi:MFS family permease
VALVERVGGEREGQTSSIRQVAMASFIGTSIEWYDFVLSYVTAELGLSENVGLVGVLIAATIGLVTVPLFAALSDRVGRRPLYLFGSVFLLLFSFPFFWLLNTGTTVLIWLAIVLAINLGHDAMYGPQAAYFSELFGTLVRYSGPPSATSSPPSSPAGSLSPSPRT